jgi:hypothetical protein
MTSGSRERGVSPTDELPQSDLLLERLDVIAPGLSTSFGYLESGEGSPAIEEREA